MEKRKILETTTKVEISNENRSILNIDQKPPTFDTDSDIKLPRTLREQYLLEKERIKYEIGDLEQIRISMGYSQRRMCQLLLVDPSAWTRWTKTLSGAPPHVYQALRWLTELKKVNPDAAAPSNIAKKVDFVQASTHARLKELESEIAALERAVALTPTGPSYTGNDFAIESILRSQETKWEQKFALLKAQLDALLNVPRKRKKKIRKIRATKKRNIKSTPKKKAKAKSKRKIKKKRR